MKAEIDLEQVRTKYNNIDKIWNPDDKWHCYTRKVIEDFVTSFVKKSGDGRKLKILNAGSGGENYGLDEHEHLHVDIAEAKLRDIPHSLVSNIEKIPLYEVEFDICLCVGSVINYCDAFRAIGEFHRLLKRRGALILEFESSRSFEYVFHNGFNQNAAVVNTFYQGQIERLWAYSEEFVESITSFYGFSLLKVRRFHIFSPLIYLITRHPNISAIFAESDKLLEKIPPVSKFCSNIILAFEKTA